MAKVELIEVGIQMMSALSLLPLLQWTKACVLYVLVRFGKFNHRLIHRSRAVWNLHAHPVHFWFAPIAHLALSCPGSSKLDVDMLICWSLFSPF